MICKSFCVDNIVTLPNITAWITVTLYDVSHLTVICSNLADNNLSGEIPKRLLQVSHYRYGQGYILQTILRLVLHNTDNCNSSYIGNHLNCGQHLISCEGNNINTGGSNNSKLKVVASIGGAVTLLVIIVLFLLWWQRMRHRPEIYVDVPG
jgi:hypothetical protein